MATIICRDCGDERHRVPRNTLYCKRCRVLRNIDYWRKTTRRCADCDAPFAPLDRNDNWCSKCNPGLQAHRGPCALARGEHEGLYVTGSVPICADCMRDPAQRRFLISALSKGQAKRRAANNHKED